MAMREVRLAGGYADVLDTELGDVLGRDLTGATVKAMLWPEGDTYPTAGEVGWQTPTAELGAGGGTVAMSVSGAVAGHFHWWLKLTVPGLPAPVLLRVRDPDDPNLPWHIWVH